MGDGLAYSQVYPFLVYYTVILCHKSDEPSTAIPTSTEKHSNWLKNTMLTFYNLRLTVI